jgi:SAM-dependent methyltransferase
MPVELAVIVPTRGRPENIRKVIAAWDFTNAWDAADLILAVDADDPELPGYRALFEEHRHPDTDNPLFSLQIESTWRPMVHKLDRVAVAVAESRKYFAVGFAGDDHLPQTIDWAKTYLTALHEMGTGLVYGDDGYQGRNLCTEWAVTSDVVRALGRMIPAPVEHMYSDVSILDLMEGAGAARHLPQVRIEHMHPIVGKAENDEQYKRVNSREQFKKDELDYNRWKTSTVYATQKHIVRELRAGLPDEPAARARPRPVRSVRGPVRRSGPIRRKTEDTMRSRNFPFSREFKEVRGATPDEIGMTLADLAVQVPADQEIVELGVFQGRTALILAWGAKQGHGAHVTAIDAWDLEGNTYGPPFNDAESRTWATYRIRELGYNGRITLIQGFSHEVAGMFPEPWFTDGKKVGLLFVDDDHSYAGARRAIEAWAPHLAPGATIAVDDYGHPDWPGAKEAVDELVAEGFLAPIEIYHDRLAVTRLAENAGERSQRGLTAITSEGVSPSPVDTQIDRDHAALGGHEDWMADPEPTPEEHAVLEAEWRRVDPEGVAALEASAEELTRRCHVQPGELEDPLAGSPIEDLNTTQLRALAKHRDIKLGARKDKRDAMLQALRAGE